MSTVHSFDLGEYVNVFQMHPSKGLLFEGRAAIADKVEDVDEYYVVRFQDEQEVAYERFIDRDGQGDPQQYIREFNKKIGYKAA